MVVIAKPFLLAFVLALVTSLLFSLPPSTVTVPNPTSASEHLDNALLEINWTPSTSPDGYTINYTLNAVTTSHSYIRTLVTDLSTNGTYANVENLSGQYAIEVVAIDQTNQNSSGYSQNFFIQENDIMNCTTLNLSGTYSINVSINTSLPYVGYITCIQINASNVSINGKANYIQHTVVDNFFYGVENNGKNVTVNNMTIINFLYGIISEPLTSIHITNANISAINGTSYWNSTYNGIVLGIALWNESGGNHTINNTLIQDVQLGIKSLYDNYTSIKNVTINRSNWAVENAESKYIDAQFTADGYDRYCFIDTHTIYHGVRDAYQHMQYNATCRNLPSFWINNTNNVEYTVANHSFIYVYNSTNITVWNYSASRIGMGLYIVNSTSVSVYNYTSTFSRTAVEAENVTNLLLENITVISSSFGEYDFDIFVRFSNHSTIKNLTYSCNPSDGYSHVGLQYFNTSDAHIYNSIFKDSKFLAFPFRFDSSGGSAENITIKDTLTYSAFEVDHAVGDGGAITLSNIIVNRTNSTNYTVILFTMANNTLLNNLSIDNSNGSFMSHYLYSATSGPSNLTFNDLRFYNQSSMIYLNRVNFSRSTVGYSYYYGVYSLTETLAGINSSYQEFNNTNGTIKFNNSLCFHPRLEHISLYRYENYTSSYDLALSNGSSVTTLYCSGPGIYYSPANFSTYVISFFYTPVNIQNGADPLKETSWSYRFICPENKIEIKAIEDAEINVFYRTTLSSLTLKTGSGASVSFGSFGNGTYEIMIRKSGYRTIDSSFSYSTCPLESNTTNITEIVQVIQFQPEFKNHSEQLIVEEVSEIIPYDIANTTNQKLFEANLSNTENAIGNEKQVSNGSSKEEYLAYAAFALLAIIAVILLKINSKKYKKN